MSLAAGFLALGMGIAPAGTDPGVPIPETFRMDDYRSAVPTTVPGGLVLDTGAMQKVVVGGEAVLIDVLPAPRRPDAMRPGVPWLPARHQALPGSLWWPDVGRGALAPELENRFRHRLHEVTAGSPDKLVVFYCLSNCWMSWNAARRAAAMGIRAGWYPEGVDGWRAAGLPTEDVKPEGVE